MPIEFDKLGGWVPNPRGVDDVMAELPHPVFAGSAGELVGYDKTDTVLWPYLLACFPNYRRGAQAIGSCVAWGAEICETILCCKHWSVNGQKPIAEVATEANYGGCRVEALGKKSGGWSDGAYGAAMAKFASSFGVVLRTDHSEITGNPEHDLRRYDGSKEKQWGNFGCGGQSDKGKLDQIAKLHPVQTVSQMHGFDDVAACVAGSQCPVTIASMYGTDMRRDKYGQCYRRGSWAHQMAIIGVRFGSHPAALIAQSWGPNSASGPTGDEYTDNLPEGGTPANIAGWTWWAPASDVDWICKSGDCWGFGDVDGWKIDRTPMPLTWKDWKQPNWV